MVPTAAFGSTPVYRLLGTPGPTPATFVGLAVIAAAWAYFVVVVVALDARRRRDPFIIAALACDIVLLVTFAVTSLHHLDALGATLLLAAAVLQLAIAARAARVGVRVETAEQETVSSLR